jgi:pantetheine-phosphate adenylyltransferase
MRVAVCPGSFDPITNGHLDIIDRACYLYDKIIVGVAVNPEKKPLFTVEERVRFIKGALEGRDKVVVEPYDTLLVDFARKCKAKVIIRGLRAVSDFEREFQIAQFNKKLDPTIETVFMMASPQYAYLSSSVVKEIAKYGGCVRGLVPEEVEEELYAKFSWEKEHIRKEGG